MSDLGEFFRDWNERKKQRKQQRLDQAEPLKKYFTIHTQWHWSTTLQGKRVDFWPSTNTWYWDNRTYHGTHDDFVNFLRKRGWKPNEG